MCSNWVARLVRRLAGGLVVSLSIGVLSGCGSGSSYELAPVQGKLTMGNRPLAGAKVMFAPISTKDTTDAGKPAVGLTESDGKFTLTTYSAGDGAVVGEHWVTIFAPQTAAPDKAQAGDSASSETKYKRVTVPQKQIVSAGQDNVIDLAL